MFRKTLKDITLILARRLSGTGSILTLVFMSSASHAAEPYRAILVLEEALGFMKNVSITINDQVKGGCWTNPDTVEAKMRLAFAREGVNVLNHVPGRSNFFSQRVGVVALGFRDSLGTCSGHVSVSVSMESADMLVSREDIRIMYIGEYATFKRSSIFVSSTNMNADIEDFVEGVSAQILERVVSLRNSEAVQATLAATPAERMQPPPPFTPPE